MKGMGQLARAVSRTIAERIGLRSSVALKDAISPNPNHIPESVGPSPSPEASVSREEPVFDEEVKIISNQDVTGERGEVGHQRKGDVERGEKRDTEGGRKIEVPMLVLPLQGQGLSDEDPQLQRQIALAHTFINKYRAENSGDIPSPFRLQMEFGGQPSVWGQLLSKIAYSSQHYAQTAETAVNIPTAEGSDLDPEENKKEGTELREDESLEKELGSSISFQKVERSGSVSGSGTAVSRGVGGGFVVRGGRDTKGTKHLMHDKNSGEILTHDKLMTRIEELGSRLESLQQPVPAVTTNTSKPDFNGLKSKGLEYPKSLEEGEEEAVLRGNNSNTPLTKYLESENVRETDKGTKFSEEEKSSIFELMLDSDDSMKSSSLTGIQQKARERKDRNDRHGYGLFVRNIPKTVKEVQLGACFERFGEVLSARIPERGFTNNNFGFIYLKTEKGLRAALSEPAIVLHGKFLQLEVTKDTFPKLMDPELLEKFPEARNKSAGEQDIASGASNPFRVWISNLPVTASPSQIRYALDQCGEIESIKMEECNSHESLQAIVDFKTPEGQLAALELYRFVVEGVEASIRGGNYLSTVFRFRKVSTQKPEKRIRDCCKDVGSILAIQTRSKNVFDVILQHSYSSSEVLAKLQEASDGWTCELPPRLPRLGNHLASVLKQKEKIKSVTNINYKRMKEELQALEDSVESFSLSLEDFDECFQLMLESYADDVRSKSVAVEDSTET